MKFTYQGVEYRISFQYENRKTGRKKVRNYCTARIETGDEREKTYSVVAQGTVVRYHADRFLKEEARQYALDKTLANLSGEFIRTLANAGSKSLTNEEITTTVKTFASVARTAYHTRP